MTDRRRKPAEQREQAKAARQATSLNPGFGQDLPVLEHAEEIAEAVRQHPVVVICGETGSGKSTQLPKLMLELGRGVDGAIAHTQPRRIAARSLATRVAEECDTRVGEGVGYRVRFSDRTSPGTRVKLLTDGMLLAETQSDADLADYDTIIIDEAHERSLNIDFLLGYLKRLLPRRPELRVIITSATIDPQRFAHHFDDAPVIEVSGRTYPVETRYRPLAAQSEDERERSLRQGVLDAVDELAREGRGDVLVFLPGEREIRQCAEALRKHHSAWTEVLPLFGRLSAAEQQRVFAPHAGRRIVLATNVAETSLTVPGIRYVVDSGLARISRYSYRTKVQRLPVEPIAQSSADQRAGRCGREGPGVCIRLYEQDDYEARPRFTDPEILRTNLASVILQMKHLRLGAIEQFPFVEPPDPRYVRDGLKLLDELGALDRRQNLSRLGRQLARLPIDPRLARILLAGNREGALTEMLVLAAALSIQDPRERPMDSREAADAAQSTWQDRQSDFAGLLRLWRDYREQAQHLSRRKLQAWCHTHFLSHVRMREWADVHGQLHGLVRGMGLAENAEPAKAVAIHRALLTGFLSNIARREDGSEYRGARDLKLAIHPGSGVVKKRPRWIVAAELVETRRVFARTVAEVRPEWIEPLARHLLKRRVHSPWWQADKGKVMGREELTLYGLPIVSGRKIDYAQVAPAEAREVFIRDGLLGEPPPQPPEFLSANQALVAELETLEAKTRRRDVVADLDALYAFYDEALPAEVVDGPSLQRWLDAGGDDRSLRLSREQLMARGVESTGVAYPDHLAISGVQLPLRYHFEPTASDDGVSVCIPIAALNALDPEPFEWLVPGLLEEKVITLIRALPKSLRRHFVPVPDFAQAVLEALPDREGSLESAVRGELRRMTGIDLPGDIWEAVSLPAHLSMHFIVLDEEGQTIASGRDLPALQRDLAGRATAQFAARTEPGFERTGITDWDFGDLPDQVAFDQGGITLQGYPALQVESEGLALRLLDSPERAETIHRAGVRQLLMKRFAQQARQLRRGLEGLDRMALLYRDVDGPDGLRRDLTAAVFDQVFLQQGVPRDRAGWLTCCEAGREGLIAAGEQLRDRVSDILSRQEQVRRALKGNVSLGLIDSYQDIRHQLDGLIYPGFLLETPPERLADLPRYLEGLRRRVERLERDPSRDQAGLAVIQPHQQRLDETRERHARRAIRDPALEQVRWLIEEYRISLFAQELGTRERVSEKRLARAWEDVR
ncbi:MAG: ATP-dependent RNA helicase HrpA [Spiribacter sp.]|nr:ATP-dependent RNA helicase HrpA [Spiribacter sp.]